MPIKITAKTEKATAKLEAIKAALAPAEVDKVIERVALETLRDLVESTKAAIGTRPDGSRWHLQKPENHWIIRNEGLGRRVLANPDKVMRFLDQGTRAHGPVTARALYIPLTKRAAGGYIHGLVWGVDFVLVGHVKGMTALNIVAKCRDRAKKRLLERMKEHIREALNGKQ